MVRMIILDDLTISTRILNRDDILEAFPSIKKAIDDATAYNETNKEIISKGCSKCMAKSKMNSNISKEVKKAIGFLSDEDKQKLKSILNVTIIRVVFTAKDRRIVDMEF